MNIAALSFFFLCLSSPILSHAKDRANDANVAYGGQDQGGGNMAEMEFRRRGLELIAAFNHSRLQDSALGFNLSELTAAVESVDAVGEYCRPKDKDGQSRRVGKHCRDSNMNLKGRRKDALNSLKNKKIWFDIDRWDEADLDGRRLLALREYLRFTSTPAGDPTSDALYDLSVKAYLMLVNLGYFSLGTPANLESMVRDLIRDARVTVDESKFNAASTVLFQLITESIVQAARCDDYMVYVKAFKRTSLGVKNKALYDACMSTVNEMNRQVAAMVNEKNK